MLLRQTRAPLRSLSLVAATAASVLLTGVGTAQTADPAVGQAAPAATPSPATSPPVESGGRAAIGSFGFDLAGRDLDVKPGDDFFRHSGGGWMRANPIPADLARWGSFDQLAAKAESDIRAIIDELVAKPQVPGSNEQKIADFYRSFMDLEAFEKRGMEPAAAALADIARAKTHQDIAALIARPDLPVSAPIAWYIGLDRKNPDRYVITILQSGLGLPEREYYRRNDSEFGGIRARYLAHVSRLLALAGQPAADETASRILMLESEIAELHWPVARRRDPGLTYNLRTRAQLEALAPDYPWSAALGAAGLGKEREFIVSELDAIGPLATLFKATPVDTWRSYLTYHYLRNTAVLLPAAFDEEVFGFFGKTLNGQPEQRPRWKRAITALDGALGEALGEIYVKRHFPAESKAKMQSLVDNLRAAFRERIDQQPWMTAATKKAAQDKLALFRAKIGYPDRWRDYGKLEVRAGDAFGNAARVRVFLDDIERARLGRKSDRDEWALTPQTVNAYYVREFNEIVFPAAILQPPFFDPNADPAINYGGIGWTIGHEMGHGFDDQGSKFDGRGVLRNWWSAEDEAAFKVLGDRLASQYAAFEALPGLKLNGRLTLGENIGDLGGMSIAHAAYLRSLGGKEPAVIEGLTGEQRFFHAMGQVWRNLYREQRLRTQVMVGPHSPPEFRVNGAVRNMDAWYEAFDVKPGDRLYLPPGERVHIW